MNKFAALAGVGMALALAACGPKVTTNSNGDVSVSNNGTTITAGRNLPANLPSWLKVYPGADVKAGAVLGQGGMISFESNDSPDKIVAFYKDIAQANHIDVQMDSSQMQGNATGDRAISFQAAAPSKLNFTLTIATRNGHNEVGILYGPQS
ncbi:MAG: hypothetical protein U1E50_18240 [Caulobacteraceae bacterium]